MVKKNLQAKRLEENSWNKIRLKASEKDRNLLRSYLQKLREHILRKENLVYADSPYKEPQDESHITAPDAKGKSAIVLTDHEQKETSSEERAVLSAKKRKESFSLEEESHRQNDDTATYARSADVIQVSDSLLPIKQKLQWLIFDIKQEVGEPCGVSREHHSATRAIPDSGPAMTESCGMGKRKRRRITRRTNSQYVPDGGQFSPLSENN